MAVNRRLVDRIEQARARSELTGAPIVVTVSAPAASRDPLAVALSDPETMAYWTHPDAGVSIGAVGSAASIDVPADGTRFEVAADRLRDLRARTIQVALEGADRTPVVTGGFSFFAESEWAGFGAGRLVLPQLALIGRQDNWRWVAAESVTSTDVAEQVAATLLGRIEYGERLVVEEGPAGTGVAAPSTDHAYVDLVASAVQDIQSSGLDKVVLAREIVVGHTPGVALFLRSLSATYPSCVTFAFGSSSGTFCGATPERLVGSEGVQVSTAAVAATAPRGATAEEDAAIAARLQSDPKEVEEHGYVVSDIHQRLTDAGCVVGAHAPTEVMQLPGLQHLYTPITATAPVGTNVLDVVGALHPTAAVGGLPTKPSLDWIAQHEPLGRGWYASPVGYCDLAGNGEFRVALRSALLEPGQSRLFAGAGIVAGSDAQAEHDETTLKLQALLPTLLAS